MNYSIFILSFVLVMFSSVSQAVTYRCWIDSTDAALPKAFTIQSDKKEVSEGKELSAIVTGLQGENSQTRGDLWVREHSNTEALFWSHEKNSDQESVIHVAINPYWEDGELSYTGHLFKSGEIVARISSCRKY